MLCLYPRIVAAASSSVIEEDVSPEESSKLCLSDQLSLELSNLAIQLERAFRAARDTEFAVKDGKIFLLQSRPITSFLAWSDEDLEHEFDTATSTEKDIVTKGNVGYVPLGFPSNLCQKYRFFFTF